MAFYPDMILTRHISRSIALGVKGTPQRSDVQRPSTAKPCGSIAIAANLDTSTAIPAAADGTVTMNVQNCARPYYFPSNVELIRGNLQSMRKYSIYYLNCWH
jgi:hypothetical protein